MAESAHDLQNALNEHYTCCYCEFNDHDGILQRFQKKYYMYIDKEAIEIFKKTNTWVLYYQELGPKARKAFV